jgi:P-type Ca2+ transporter type 2B
MSSNETNVPVGSPNDDEDTSALKSQKQSVTSTSSPSSNSFGLTLNQLKELMELKNAEVKKKVDDDYGGLKAFAFKLKTDTMRGLTGESDDLEARVKEFVKNFIPPKPPKSIFRLAFEALQDTTLIMLMICAVISVGLSFYHPAPDELEEEFSRVKTDTIGSLEWIEGVAVSFCF